MGNHFGSLKVIDPPVHDPVLVVSHLMLTTRTDKMTHKGLDERQERDWWPHAVARESVIMQMQFEMTSSRAVHGVLKYLEGSL